MPNFGTTILSEIVVSYDVLGQTFCEIPSTLSIISYTLTARESFVVKETRARD